MKKNQKSGEVPENRIPIVDHEGNVRGHVGHTANQATVARFLGRHGAELKQQDGRLTWVGKEPPPPPAPNIPMLDSMKLAPNGKPTKLAPNGKPTSAKKAALGSAKKKLI